MIDGKGTLALLLNDTIMSKQLRLTVSNLQMASRDASKSIKELNELVSSLRTNNESVLGVLLNDSTSGNKLRTIVSNLESSSIEIDKVTKNINETVNKINSSEGAFNYIVKDTSLVNSLKSTLENINEGTYKFNQNMEALKHNFLTRGYFRKLERQEKKNN